MARPSGVTYGVRSLFGAGDPATGEATGNVHDGGVIQVLSAVREELAQIADARRLAHRRAQVAARVVRLALRLESKQKNSLLRSLL